MKFEEYSYVLGAFIAEYSSLNDNDADKLDAWHSSLIWHLNSNLESDESLFSDKTIPITALEEGFNYLEEKGVAFVYRDDFTPPYFKILTKKLNIALSQKTLPREVIDKYNKYNALGAGWLLEALQNIQATDTVSNIVIPASDRIVTLDDNSKEFKTVQADLSSLITGVKASNSFGDEDPEEKDAVLADMAAGQELLNAGHFWVKSLWETLIKALKLLIKKFGDAGIGQTASKLLEELTKLLG